MPIYLIALPEVFTYSFHRPFFEHLDQVLASPEIEQVDFDLSQVDYLDSSGIGLLVQFYKNTQGRPLLLRLVNAHGQAKDILATAQIEQIYELC